MWRAVWLCFCLSGLVAAEDLPSVVIGQGALRGVFLETRGGRQISAFLGIPYVSAPVGPLRFQKPLPPAAWEGVRVANKSGSPCIQASPMKRKGEVFGDEDCLYLNVYTHKVSSESKHPVMVFIHGGGFNEGSGDLYRPDYLMDRDILLVTINYRLGPLGFLSMEDTVLPGNNGMKDQVAALKWVNENIRQFGGDPAAVTIFGESAGAASVHLHMLSPLSKGLFQRGISHSGSAYCPWSSHAPGQLRLASERFASQLGCNHHSTQDTLDCLRDMPAYVLVDVASSLYDWNYDPVIQFPPAIEPKGAEEAFLTEDPWKLTSDISWITGVNNAEGRFKVDVLSKKEIVELNDEFELIGPLTLCFRATAEDPVHTAHRVKKFYFFDGDITPNNLEELTKMYTDSWFLYPILESFRRHRGPKYLYYFDYRGWNSLSPDYYGVNHFDDMQYFFPMEPFYNNVNVSAEDQKMSEKLLDLWTTFATHGTPSLDKSEIIWNDGSKESEFLHIKKSGLVMEKDLLKERDSFWSQLPYREKYLDLDNSSESEKDEL